ncbi:hypothetical protein OR1_04150 [Geobacter sp. OR-1]|uniref:hypothetical protein n=1 Tax=Geobacter sp. OR-1 TaxID=1266765 RepID=UPI0005444674|nr:hypothetical protein [Geobacter sp. OR-1]GAM11832.1 hypothetical protein OR1_04150 [Geobacter sp. OR-1]
MRTVDITKRIKNRLNQKMLETRRNGYIQILSALSLEVNPPEGFLNKSTLHLQQEVVKLVRITISHQ